MYRREFLIGAGTTMLATSLAGRAFGQDVPANYPADYAAMIEASKSEPEVILYTTFSDAFWAPMKDLIKASYPWINLQTLDQGGPEILERYRMENAASARTADMLVFIGPAEWYDLVQKGDILDYKSPEIPNLPEWSLTLPGAYFITMDTSIFAWNKLLLPDAPTGLEGLVERARAEPDFFRGRLATPPIFAQSLYYLEFLKLLGRHGEQLWEWIEVLAPLTRVERSSVTMFDKTLAGEYVLSYFINQEAVVRATRDPRKAAVFGWSFPSDGMPISARLGGVTKGATSPNSAKLILDLLLSKAGQIEVAKNARFPYRTDITPEDVGENAYTYQMAAAAVGPENALLINYSPELMVQQEEIVARWRAIFKV